MRILLVINNNCLQKAIYVIGSFDSPVHISEEASNAATAVPWAIILSTSTAGILGIGTVFIILVRLASYLFQALCTTAMNVALAFCMGQDLDRLMESNLGQPMAQIFLNSFGHNGTLAMWSFIILAQYMMGSSTVCFRSYLRSSI